MRISYEYRVSQLNKVLWHLIVCLFQLPALFTVQNSRFWLSFRLILGRFSFQVTYRVESSMACWYILSIVSLLHKPGQVQDARRKMKTVEAQSVFVFLMSVVLSYGLRNQQSSRKRKLGLIIKFRVTPSNMIIVYNPPVLPFLSVIFYHFFCPFFPCVQYRARTNYLRLTSLHSSNKLCYERRR